jgi:hypothetical protein
LEVKNAPIAMYKFGLMLEIDTIWFKTNEIHNNWK